MATLEQLEADGSLLRYVADLEHFEMPERCISEAPNFKVWRETQLMEIPKIRGRNLSPHEQVEQCFYDFVIGRPLTYGVHSRRLEPHGFYVWELKQPIDVRIFGWVPKKGHFVAVCGEQKSNLTTKKLYKPFIKSVVDFRAALPLDEPKAITKLSYQDVF